uniref:Uncharacterized protein n=1 Tax=Solanum tuberosum TaxID=4113 RepID=M1DNX8_SOLTU
MGGKGKGKRSTSDMKTTLRDPNVPSWDQGFCAVVHVFLENYDVTTPSGYGTVVPPELRANVFICCGVRPIFCDSILFIYLELEVDEGQCKKAMNQTKERIAEWIGDPD